MVCSNICQIKVTNTDAGRILFPSITICKDEMFNSVRYSERGLITRLQSGEVSAENARSWFRNRTFSRAHLVKFLSIKTVEGSEHNNYPCDAASGPKAGEPCSFPFFYPDCKLTTKVTRCKLNPDYVIEEYQEQIYPGFALIGLIMMLLSPALMP